MNSEIVAELFIGKDYIHGYDISLRESSFLNQIKWQIYANEEANKLLYEVIEGNIPQVQALLDRGFDPNSTLGVKAIGAKCYLNKYPGSKTSGDFTEVSHDKYEFNINISALMLAAWKAKPEMVGMLLSAGANPNYVGAGQQTALHLMLDANPNYSAESKEFCLRKAKLLVSTGANINRSDSLGNSPLIAACEHGYDDVARLLIERGADIEWRGQNGATPLLIATKEDNYDLVSLLLASRADVSKSDDDGLTALHISSASGFKKIVKLLLDNRAKVNAVDSYGKTPLDLMNDYDWSLDASYCRCWENKKEIMKLLIDKGGHFHI